MEYVADTHSILWHLFAPHRLGSSAKSAFSDCDAGTSLIYLPSVVIAEMIMVAEKGRLPGIAISQLLAQLSILQNSSNYVLLPLLPEVVIASHTLTAIPDIFDRLIVADARHLSIPLISRDTVIIASGLVSVVWD
jgi:PIN domain nuclease of toxin-antitoxin system